MCTTRLVSKRVKDGFSFLGELFLLNFMQYISDISLITNFLDHNLIYYDELSCTHYTHLYTVHTSHTDVVRHKCIKLTPPDENKHLNLIKLNYCVELLHI